MMIFADIVKDGSNADTHIARRFFELLVNGEPGLINLRFALIQKYRPKLGEMLLERTAGFTTTAGATSLCLDFLAGDHGKLKLALSAVRERLEGPVIYEEGEIATAILKLILSDGVLTGEALWYELVTHYPAGDNLNIGDLQHAVDHVLEVKMRAKEDE